VEPIHPVWDEATVWDHSVDLRHRWLSAPQHLVGLHGEVVLTEGPIGFELAELAVYWRGPGRPVHHRLESGALTFEEGAALLERLDGDELGALVVATVRRLSNRRRRRYRRCELCREMVPPEHRLGDSVCMTCATEQLGVVY
jgi:hypothetical protein